MRELLRRLSWLTSSLTGIVTGTAQGLHIPKDPIVDEFNPILLVAVGLLGLLVPPIAILLNRRHRPKIGARLFLQVNQYFNLSLWMTFGCLSMGVTAFAMYFAIGGEQASLVDAAFFLCGGVGFFIGYRIHPGMGI